MIVRPDIPDTIVEPWFCPTQFVRHWHGVQMQLMMRKIDELDTTREVKCRYLDAARRAILLLPTMQFKDGHVLLVQAGCGYASAPPRMVQPGETWRSFEVDAASDPADVRLFAALTGETEGPWCLDVETVTEVIAAHGGIINTEMPALE